MKLLFSSNSLQHIDCRSQNLLQISAVTADIGVVQLVYVHLMLLQFGFGLDFDAADIADHAGVRVSSVEVAKVQIATPQLRKPLARAVWALVDLLAAVHSVVDFSFLGGSESFAAALVFAEKRPLVAMDHHVHVELRLVAEPLTAAGNKTSTGIHFARLSLLTECTASSCPVCGGNNAS